MGGLSAKCGSQAARSRMQTSMRPQPYKKSDLSARNIRADVGEAARVALPQWFPWGGLRVHVDPCEYIFLCDSAFFGLVCPVSIADTQTSRTRHVTCIASPLAFTFASEHDSFSRMDDPHRALGYSIQF